MYKWWQGVLLGVGIALAVLASYRIGLYYGQKSPTIITQVELDTLCVTRVDTLVLPPKLVERRVVDTMWFTAPGDSLALPVEEREYGDSTYYAEVSGIHPSLDSLVVYPRIQDRYITKEVTHTIPPPRWSLGVSVGPAIGYYITPAGWQPGAGISLQVGVSYRF